MSDKSTGRLHGNLSARPHFPSLPSPSPLLFSSLLPSPPSFLIFRFSPFPSAFSLPSLYLSILLSLLSSLSPITFPPFSSLHFFLHSSFPFPSPIHSLTIIASCSSHLSLSPLSSHTPSFFPYVYETAGVCLSFYVSACVYTSISIGTYKDLACVYMSACMYVRSRTQSCIRNRNPEI